MRTIRNIILFSMLFTIVGACAENNSTTKIVVNQVGYFPNQTKIAIVISKANKFQVFSIDKEKLVLDRQLSSPKYWAAADESVKVADFTEVNETGFYKIIVDGKESFKFEISNSIYSTISKAALKTFYYQRASIELKEKFAGKWKREAGLLDTAVIVHQSAESKFRPIGTIISSPRGWFDAGDYNKYIVSSSVTTYTLILLYELFPEYFKSLSLNIPESKNTTPDILDEILWNVRWMLTMQDPGDGGVYHKVTSKTFQPYIMPSDVKAKRYVVGKSTVAALNFSAVLSHLSVVLKEHNHELKSLSDSCLTMSKKAWEWAINNPNKHFENPDDIETGVYGDSKLKDNFFWAGMELYFATKDKSYLRYVDKLNQMVVDSLYWAKVANLGIITALTGNVELKKSLKELDYIENIFKNSVDNIYSNNINSPYRISLNVFKWGSNANLLNETLLLLTAYKIYKNEKYLTAAITNTDYILGRNPVNISYVTGYGEEYPMNIHHRICEADSVDEPIPGFVVGGPNPYYLIDCGKNSYPSLLPAKCYLDDVCSYSTNEVAINWNAPLAFVLFTLDYYSKTINNKN